MPQVAFFCLGTALLDTKISMPILLELGFLLFHMDREGRGVRGRAATAAGSIWPSWTELALKLAVLWKSLARVSLFRSIMCIRTGIQLPVWFPSETLPNSSAVNGDSFFLANYLLVSSLALL